MPEPPKQPTLLDRTNDYVAAWEDRKRTFDDLRNQTMSDEARHAAIAAYVDASKRFDAARAELMRK